MGEKGDARLLEIGGTAVAAVIDYVRTLREFAFESIHGNRASPERLSSAQSGRAIELMNQGLLWLTDNLRITYGEVALLSLARMIVRASSRYALRVAEGKLPAMDPSATLSLKWPGMVSNLSRGPSAATRPLLQTLINSGLLSRSSAAKAIANSYDIDNVAAELAQCDSDQSESK